MPTKSLADLASRMAAIDVAILSTHAANDAIAGRPMSNNGQVELDGASFYFTTESTGAVADIERNPNVALGFQGASGFYLTVEGSARLIRDQSRYAEHWTPGLDSWFPDGPSTEGVVMIEVSPARLHYWVGMEDAEIAV